jgi:hypothetical protein
MNTNQSLGKKGGSQPLFVWKPNGQPFHGTQEAWCSIRATRSLLSIAGRTLREPVSVPFAHITSRLMHHSGHCRVSSVMIVTMLAPQIQYLAYVDLKRHPSLLLMLPTNFDVFRSAGQRIGVQILTASAEIGLH